MKKILATFGMVIALVFSAMGGFAAFADVSLEECDKCFQTTVNNFLQSSEVEGTSINALRKPVYDIKLQHLGYAYEFEIVDGESYAIIICDNGNYIAQEFVPGTQSPYSQVDEQELCVYINSMTYLKYNGDSFCDIATSLEIPEEMFNTLSKNAILYSDNEYSDNKEKVIVTVNFQERKTNPKSLCQVIPRYTSPGGIKSACAAVAGSNIVGFYDRYYEDLIPNHVAGKEVYGFYRYNLADEYVDNVTRDLYYKMNGSEAGISETDFKNGMKQYCAEKNLTCDFTQLKSGGRLSYSAVAQSIDENKPVALLLSTYTVCEILSSDSHSETFFYDVYKGDHIMVGFGCCSITYKLTDGTNATYEFVYVASGYNSPLEAYFNMNYCTNINSAYKVYIH